MANQRHRQPVTLETLLAGQSSLARDNNLYNQLETLRRLQTSISSYIDPALIKYCRIGNYKNEILTITASSATWASRLRFSVPEILAAIRERPLPVRVKSIRVVVAPNQDTDTTRQTKRKPSLSMESARFMRQIADSIDDAELSASIRRLSRNSSLK